MTSARTVADVGEAGVVTLLRQRVASASGVVGIGDDAAVFASPGRTLVLTTDTMVEGVDFDLAYSSGADLGWKVLAVNVSDLAAMGAEPAQAVTTMCLPAATPLALVEDVIDGLVASAARWEVQLVGGDLSSGPTITLGVALLGSTAGAVLRSGAQVGDAICVTGELGGSAGGLAQLQRDPTATGPLVTRHLRPNPRVAEGSRLREAGATAMLDVSDGLAIDLTRLLDASGVGCEVDETAIPVDRGLSDSGIDGLRAALLGGEDFELLFTLASEKVEEARTLLSELGTDVTRIGTVTSGPRRIGSRDLEVLKEEAWDHLQAR